MLIIARQIYKRVSSGVPNRDLSASAAVRRLSRISVLTVAGL